MTTDDMELLREYARRNSEEAFAALVSRHVNLVYSVALRRTRDPHLAGEITQAVFVILARKAGSLGDKTILSGWLCRTARYVADNALTIQRRRQRREQEAFMQTILNEPENEMWTQIAPLLDAALAGLGEKDHNAIVLRFFENKNLKEVGAALGASEDAAKKRVSRALEKLRRFFVKRGVTSTTAETLAETISANSVQAAPALLAKTATAVALAKGAAVGGSILILVKGALKLMAWAKAKTAIVVGGGILFMVVMTVVTIQESISSPIDKYLKTLDSGGAMAALENAPPLFVIQKTHFANLSKESVFGISTGDKMMGRDADLANLVYEAYQIPGTRMVFSDDLPSECYDYMITVADHPREQLKEELKKRFGITAHLSLVETNVLALIISQPKNLKLKASQGDPVRTKQGQAQYLDNLRHGIWFYANQPLDSMLCVNAESDINQPVVNQTGLTNNFDITLDLHLIGTNRQENLTAWQNALHDQLGLELVPTNMPIEMLVVEKAK